MGSNVGDRAGYLVRALRSILEVGLGIRRLSSVYETEPVGVLDEQPHFLNMVAELDGDSLPSPERLLQTLLDIETALGRTREAPLAARTIDLDLLLYGNEQHESPVLTLPHPRLHLRRFVLAPLVELVPDELHPALKVSYRELLTSSSDDSAVRIWTPE